MSSIVKKVYNLESLASTVHMLTKRKIDYRIEIEALEGTDACCFNVIIPVQDTEDKDE